jgi:hypothetical protein
VRRCTMKMSGRFPAGEHQLRGRPEQGDSQTAGLVPRAKH